MGLKKIKLGLKKTSKKTQLPTCHFTLSIDHLNSLPLSHPPSRCRNFSQKKIHRTNRVDEGCRWRRRKVEAEDRQNKRRKLEVRRSAMEEKEDGGRGSSKQEKEEIVEAIEGGDH